MEESLGELVEQDSVDMSKSMISTNKNHISSMREEELYNENLSQGIYEEVELF